MNLMQEVRSEETALKIVELKIQDMKDQLEPEVSRTRQALDQTTASVDSLYTQLYERAFPASDAAIISNHTMFSILCLMFIPVAIISMAGHISTLLQLGLGTVPAFLFGVSLTIAVAGAGHFAFRNLVHGDSLFFNLAALACFALCAYGLWEFAQSRNLISSYSETGASGADVFVDDGSIDPSIGPEPSESIDTCNPASSSW